MRFIICIKNFGLFKKGSQYATPFCNLGPGVKQLSYQIFSKSNYTFMCSISYKDFEKNFIYVGDFKIELDWCEELFNILMDGEGDLYNLVC